MVTILFILVSILAIFLASAIIHIMKIQQELEAIDKEQHSQNNDIIMLMKKHMVHQEMLLQHIEILKYLVEQDPTLNKKKVIYSGPIGEA